MNISYNNGGCIVSRTGNVGIKQITGCDIESKMSPEMPHAAKWQRFILNWKMICMMLKMEIILTKWKK
jgi:hypothetical protein